MTITSEQVLAAMAAVAAPSSARSASLAGFGASAPTADVELSDVALPDVALPDVALPGIALPDVDRAARTVVAARAVVAAARTGAAFPDEGADELVAGIVGAVAAIESQINALAGHRAALVAVAAAVVHAVPSTMVPMSGDAPVTATDQDHARRALVADLATASRASEVTTATLVNDSCELVDHLPGVLTAMGAGVLGDKHARRIVRHAEGLPSSAMPPYEADVLSHLGADRSPAGVGRTARAARERCQPRTLEERHERASRDRAVHLDPADDGMAWLTAYLPAVQATAIYDKLTGIADVLGREEDEQRTPAQRRADVLTALVLDPPSHAALGGSRGTESHHALTGEGADRSREKSSAEPSPERPPPWVLDPALHALRPTVAVTVPVMTLLGLSDEPGQLDGHGPIDPETARVLAANAPSFIRLLTHPETGTVLSVGRERYAVPADLRTWLRLRDQRCRFPGCHRPATRSEIDHTVAFRERGARGDTAAGNLAHVCARHHRMKHTTRWDVVQDDEGRLTWTAPTGHVHTTEPGLVLKSGTARAPAPATAARTGQWSGRERAGPEPLSTTNRHLDP